MHKHFNEKYNECSQTCQHIIHAQTFNEKYILDTIQMNVLKHV